MNLAWISLAALIVAITLSMVTSMNVGVVSLAMAWIVGVYMGGMPIAKVIGAFPIDLLLNLVGVTLLFGMANNNGTLGRIASHIQTDKTLNFLFERARKKLAEVLGM